MNTVKVEGTDKGHVLLLGLSTCIWCRKTKEFLESNNVQFEYVYVDLLESEEKDKVKETLKKWNPACSYPTLVLNNSSCVIGFDEEKIKLELLL
ncbi:MAG TPA: glutaredoxin family protein [Spirochaetota bacterium]|nr:glutaredoxin family protein [Spirochaetota bacterium]HPM33955.1 glutaredoxin family protein [Spirochaetota bacterium]HPW50811.1 glutaredoxin family protein [Spirochaetota bacterium]